jgi:hypothetical protein
MKTFLSLTALAAFFLVVGPDAQVKAAQRMSTAQCMAKCTAECNRRNPGGDSGRKSACMNKCQSIYNC